MKQKHKEQILYTHYQQLIKHANLLLGNMDDACDVVQDVFVRFWNTRNKIKDQSKTKAYLFSMVNNACFDVLRSTRKFKTIPIERAANYMDKANSINNNEMKMQDIEALYGFLLQLPVEQEKVIRMRIYGNLSFVEIAKILGVPVTTVKSRFKYGIDKLREKIGKNKEAYYEM